MSTSLLAFFTLLEKRVRPLLATDKTWRCERIVDFRTREGVLQLWEEPGAILSGEVAMRGLTEEDGSTSFSGTLRGVNGATEARKFSFRPQSEAEVEHQAQLVAELWTQVLRPAGESPAQGSNSVDAV